MRIDQAIDAIVNQLRESNPNLFEERSSRYDGQLDGRRAMATFLSGRNSLGNDERVWLIARPGERGIVYLLFVAPERDFDRYEPTFRSMVQSFRFNER